MKNKEKMNNKGFSLVELIIVIAIMVILVGVLAPVYTRYVESTRKSSDVSAVADIMNAMETVMIDKSARQNGTPSAITVDVTTTTVTISDSDVSDVVGSTYTFKGTWTGSTGTIKAAWVDGGVQFTHTGTAIEDVMNHSDALKDKFSDS